MDVIHCHISSLAVAMERLKLIFNNSTPPSTITLELKILTQSDAQKYAIFHYKLYKNTTAILITF